MNSSSTIHESGKPRVSSSWSHTKHESAPHASYISLIHLGPGTVSLFLMGQSKHEFFPRASSRPSTQQVCPGTLSQVLKGQASHKSVPIHIECNTMILSVWHHESVPHVSRQLRPYQIILGLLPTHSQVVFPTVSWSFLLCVFHQSPGQNMTHDNL